MRTYTHAKILSATQQRGHIWLCKKLVLFCPWQTTRIYKAQRKVQGCITNGLLQHHFFFFSSLTLWTADISETQQVGFQNVDAYHQVYSTNSKTQPSTSILFNKALDINTHPLKPKTSKMLYSWWTLSKFRESKGYLCRQYEHGTYRALNTKAANFLFSPICRYSEKSKKTRAEGK